MTSKTARNPDYDNYSPHQDHTGVLCYFVYPEESTSEVSRTTRAACGKQWGGTLPVSWKYLSRLPGEDLASLQVVMDFGILKSIKNIV